MFPSHEEVSGRVFGAAVPAGSSASRAIVCRGTRKGRWMRAIDTDPMILRQIGETTAHAYDQALTHIEAEMKGVIPALMETLTENGPYGYTITPQVLPDGGVSLPVISTREGIEEAYKMIRGASDLLSVNPLTEIRGTWYTFQDAISRGQRKGTDQQGAPRRWASSPLPPARASRASWCGCECLDRSSAEVIPRPMSRPRRCTCGTRSSSSTIASCRHCWSVTWTASSARSTTAPHRRYATMSRTRGR